MEIAESVITGRIKLRLGNPPQRDGGVGGEELGELHAAGGGVVEREIQDAADIGHGGEALRRGPLNDVVKRLAGPEWAVSDNSGVERIDANRCDLRDQGAHHSDHAPVHG